MADRGQFSSKFGFILAASGSAIGLGNIWGFPIQVASNGGGAFVLTYIVLTFLLAYPVLMAELIIGRHAQANSVTAMRELSSDSKNPLIHFLAPLAGYWGIVTASLILSFYAIIAGWMVAYCLAAISQLLGFSLTRDWLRSFSVERNLLFTAIFLFLTFFVVAKGVKAGIERWSTLLMPLLIILIVLLIAYIATLDGAAEGWRIYLQPDFSQLDKPGLVFNALGQAFFSLSLGVGTMMIYGSYVSKHENLPRLGASVALIDISIAVLAGMLVIPAIYVAAANGVTIYNDAGGLIDSDGLIFTVLPALFAQMGIMGLFVSIVFFLMMAIAALTSSISMLEVPVAYLDEQHNLGRKKAAFLASLIIFVISIVIILNFSALFGSTVAFTTKYSEPLIGLLYCVFVAWVWNRNALLRELQQGCAAMEQTLFWRIWPNYVRFVCPALILLVFWRSLN